VGGGGKTLQFSDKQRKTPTEEILGAKILVLSLHFPKNVRFSVTNFAFWAKSDLAIVIFFDKPK